MSCPDAFHNLNIVANDNKTLISACCLMNPWEVETINFNNDPQLVEVRKKWASGQWPDLCSNCKKDENNNLPSRRQGSLQWAKDNLLKENYNKVELLKIDYYCGNTCNLRCAICGPRDSIAWQKELGINKQNRNILTNKLSVNTEKIKLIHFNGGEPLLIDEHWELLKSIKHKDNVVLNYNTNASVLPKTQLIDLWAKFKIVIIDFSIDDINERFEYQRYPAKWNAVVDNMYWLRENMPVNVMFAVNTAIGILNKENYSNLKKWFEKNFNANRVTDPVEFKTQLTSGILSIENTNSKNVINYLDTLDKRRNTNWKKTFPELEEKLCSNDKN